MRDALPIDPVLPELLRILETEPSVVLEAPPGAGKTTRVPQALLGASWLGGRSIVVLEPRRLAARMAAARVADELGEKLGETVGYTVRFDDVGGPRTRVRFVTEGVLTRRLLVDRTLEGVGAVLLDEFHERHLQGDVALALLRRLQKTSRPELRLVVMSATLDAAPVAAFLDARIVRAEGRRFEVAVEHEERPDDRPLELRVASAVRRALDAEPDGDVLVFLPGASEIRRAEAACAAVATQKGALVLPLHGELPSEAQDRAVRRASQRKIILSTNVAESSLTIDGVVAVVDSGLVRRAGFASWSGLPTLRVEKTSRASCTQRAGRAGRTRSGRALRLFSKTDLDTRPEQDTPELLRADLTQTVLELRAAEVGDVAWLDAPPAKSLHAAESLLLRLGAVEASGHATAIGRAMLRYPLHPRLGRVLVEALARGVGEDGCAAAAVLGERDLRAATRDREASKNLATERSDVLGMVDGLREAEESRGAASVLRAVGLDPARTHAALKAKKELTRMLPRSRSPAPASPEAHDEALQISILAGYIDRVARRGTGRTFALAGGGSVELAETSVVRDAPFIVAVDAEERAGKPLVRIASAIEPEWLMDLAPDALAETDTLEWNTKAERVEKVSRLAYDGLVLTETRSPAPPSERAGEVLFEAARGAGLGGGGSSELSERATFARRFDPGLPSLDAEGALRALCKDRTALAELRGVSLQDLLRAEHGAALARIDRLAPARVGLPSGRSVDVHYDPGKDPWIESRLQDFFGQATTPKIAEGRAPLVVHLLAPNHRAVQVTTDLEGFWQKHYPAVRKELMRKYPRHSWPEDPRNAEPSAGPQRRLRRT